MSVGLHVEYKPDENGCSQPAIPAAEGPPGLRLELWAFSGGVNLLSGMPVWIGVWRQGSRSIEGGSTRAARRAAPGTGVDLSRR